MLLVCVRHSVVLSPMRLQPPIAHVQLPHRYSSKIPATSVKFIKFNCRTMHVTGFDTRGAVTHIKETICDSPEAPAF